MIFALIGGVLSRAHGGGWPNLPWSLDAWLYAIPYGAICWPLIGIWSIPVYLISVMAKRTGHGGFMDLATWTRARDDERLEFIIKPFRTYLSEYWYDFTGLALTGAAVTLVPAIVLCFTSPVLGAVLLLSGAGKAVAYAIGWKVGKYPTEIGEFLTGVIGWGVCCSLLPRFIQLAL